MFPFPTIAPGQSPAIVTFTANANDATDQTTYTFSSKSIGTASADRYIVVGVGGAIGGAATISSVTLDGNAMTSVVTAAGSGGGVGTPAGLFIYGPVALGTTAEVVVTFSTGIARCGIGIWAVTGLLSAAATATGSSTADPQSASIAVGGGGVLIGYSFEVSASGASYTWTNLTERFDENVETSSAHSGASNAFSAGQSVTVTADPSVAITAGALVLAAFR